MNIDINTDDGVETHENVAEFEVAVDGTHLYFDDESESFVEGDLYGGGDQTTERQDANCPNCGEQGFDGQGYVTVEGSRMYLRQCWSCGTRFACEDGPTSACRTK